MNGQMNGTVAVEGCTSINDLMAILGGGHRFEIVQCLAQQQLDVTSIADALELGMPTISQNLRVLRQADMVDLERRKTTHIYRLSESIRVRRRGRALWLSARTPDGAILLSTTIPPELLIVP